MQRLALLPVLLLGITLLVFVLGRLIPGDPARIFAGGMRANPEVVEQIRRTWGLDEPLPVQYARYVRRLAAGDLGWSITAQSDVTDVLRDRVPATLELGVAALLVGVPAGLALGVGSARWKRPAAKRAANLAAIAGVSLPLFWVGLVLAYVFSVVLGWFPLSGRLPGFIDFQPVTGFYTVDAIIRGDFDSLLTIIHHLALPTLTLAILPATVMARFTRSSFIEVLGEPYIRTAYAYGISPRIITWRLAAKNAVLPLITLLGLVLPALLAGSVLVESVFSWPGMGTFLFRAILNRDYAVVQSITLLVGILYVVTNLLADLSYAVLDPRTRRT